MFSDRVKYVNMCSAFEKTQIFKVTMFFWTFRPAIRYLLFSAYSTYEYLTKKYRHIKSRSFALCHHVVWEDANISDVHATSTTRRHSSEDLDFNVTAVKALKLACRHEVSFRVSAPFIKKVTDLREILYEYFAS
jgi:hypothetical protein